MIAHKFLCAGAVGPFSGFRWPTPRGAEPAEWVEAEGFLAPCVNGVHACTAAVLPSWLGDELWRIELDDGEVLEDDGVLVARRGRLLERVGAWNRDAITDYARACAQRARTVADASGDAEALAYAVDAEADAAKTRSAIDAALTSLSAVRVLATLRAGGFEEERAWQARWLADRLALSS
jgi:hypothetical protein